MTCCPLERGRRASKCRILFLIHWTCWQVSSLQWTSHLVIQQGISWADKFHEHKRTSKYLPEGLALQYEWTGKEHDTIWEKTPMWVLQGLKFISYSFFVKNKGLSLPNQEHKWRKTTCNPRNGIPHKLDEWKNSIVGILGKKKIGILGKY